MKTIQFLIIFLIMATACEKEYINLMLNEDKLNNVNKITNEIFTIQANIYFFEHASFTSNYIEVPWSSLPSFLQQTINFPLFGSYDYLGGYSKFISKFQYQPIEATRLNAGYLNYYDKWGIYAIRPYILPITYYTYNNYINRFIVDSFNIGDLIIHLIARDSTSTFFYDCLIQITASTCNYISILNSLVNDSFYVSDFKFSFESTDTNQYNIPLVFINLSLLGYTQEDSINLGSYKPPTEYQGQLLYIPLKSYINKYLLWYYGFANETTNLQFNFNVTHIEKLQKLK